MNGDKNLIGTYHNGDNIVVRIYDDGTKEKDILTDDARPEFPECMDLTISTYCENGCAFCYANCSSNGKKANLASFYPLLDTIHPYTELAININGGEDPRELTPFLAHMSNRHVIVNATIRQDDFEKHLDTLYKMTKDGLLHGIGVSATDCSSKFLRNSFLFPDLVCHTIVGITTPDQYTRLANAHKKVLILGYKTVGRGVEFDHEGETFKRNFEWLDKNLDRLEHYFAVTSFDNLAIEQLNVQDRLSPEEWNRFYQGDEGSYTFFLNLAEGYFARDSMIQEKFPLMWSVDEMFHEIRERYHSEKEIAC